MQRHGAKQKNVKQTRKHKHKLFTGDDDMANIKSKIGTHKTKVTENIVDGYAEPYTEVKYHDTVVVRFDKDHIELNTGGWKSKTTKLRMNQASEQFNLGYRVYQKNFEWFVSYKDDTAELGSWARIDRRICD